MHTGQTHSRVHMFPKGYWPYWMHSTLSVCWVWAQRHFPQNISSRRGRTSELSPWNSLCFLLRWGTNPQTRKWLHKVGSFILLPFICLHEVWYLLISQRKRVSTLDSWSLVHYSRFLGKSRYIIPEVWGSFLHLVPSYPGASSKAPLLV